MKVMSLHAIGDFRYEDIEKPEPHGEEILIKIGACGICGSDIPRVFELGTRVYPVVLGHEFSGEVVAVGDSKNNDLIGKKAAIFPLIPCRECNSCEIGEYCQCENYDYLGSRSNGGFAEYCLVPSRWHLVLSKNPNLSLEELAMTEPACVAQHALRRGEIRPGETVLILGAGPIGIMIARWAKLFGARQIILTDIDDTKQKFAEDRGLTVINTLKQDLDEEIQMLTNGRGIDLVIEGTGTSPGMNDAIRSVRYGGKVVWLGNPHRDTTIQLSNHSEILRKEINMFGVWNSYYANTPINEWEYTVKMMDEGTFKVGDLITHKSNLKDLLKLFEDIYQHKITICKAMYSAKLD